MCLVSSHSHFTGPGKRRNCMMVSNFNVTIFMVYCWHKNYIPCSINFIVVVVVVQLYDIVSIRYREKGQHAKKVSSTSITLALKCMAKNSMPYNSCDR